MHLTLNEWLEQDVRPTVAAAITHVSRCFRTVPTVHLHARHPAVRMLIELGDSHTFDPGKTSVIVHFKDGTVLITPGAIRVNKARVKH